MSSLTKPELEGPYSPASRERTGLAAAPGADRGRDPEPVEATAAQLRSTLEAERRVTAWLQRELWRREGRRTRSSIDATELEDQLDAIRHSTSWMVTAPLRAIGRRAPRLAAFLRRTVKVLHWTVTLRLPRELRRRRAGLAVVRELDRRRTEESYERWVEAYDTLTDADLERMDELARGLAYRPLVSVLLPVHDPPGRYLRRAIDSVLAQRYDRWELCIADDASSAPHVRAILASYERSDPRIRVVQRTSNGGIAAASNSALELARGELVAFLDHDDELRPHALLLAVTAFNEGEHVAWVYSDEDKIDAHGRRSGPYFKPDWNPALLLSQNYLCHLSVTRTELVREVGGLRSEFDGSQDWDLALRVTETLSPDAVVHVPHVLYHWRAIPGSAAAAPEAKPYAIEAARRATEEHLRRVGTPGYAVPVNTHQSIRFLLPERPLVSVIVPSTGDPDLLAPCVTGLLQGTDYEELEILVAVDEKALAGTKAELLDHLEEDERVSLLGIPSGPFNFARTVNRAAARANGELLLLLNDDVEVVDEDWLEIMVGYALQDRAGAVGARLLYPDGTIQHAGMLAGCEGVAEHLYKGRSAHISGYLNRARLPQDLSIVAGACMLVRREAFIELGGLDETFPVAYNDIDFCLRLRRDGWRVLYAPEATLVHRESASFGSYHAEREDEHRRDETRMRDRWGALLDDDPMHNPNLALDASDPSRLAFPPRVRYPWREPDGSASLPGRDQATAKRVAESRSSSSPAYS